MKIEPHRFADLEPIAPDKNVLKLTKIVLEQNGKILAMNEELLKFLAATPILIVKDKE